MEINPNNSISLLTEIAQMFSASLSDYCLFHTNEPWKMANLNRFMLDKQMVI